MQKTTINGEETNEIFRWLRNKILYDTKKGKAKTVNGNFGKFLVDGATGKMIGYWAAQTRPKSMTSSIEMLLDRNQKKVLRQNLTNRLLTIERGHSPHH